METSLRFSGHEALRLVRNDGYHLIIVDWRMPGIDGITFPRVVPIILLTGQHDGDMVRSAEANGAYAILQEPIEREELPSYISQALRVEELSEPCETDEV